MIDTRNHAAARAALLVLRPLLVLSSEQPILRGALGPTIVAAGTKAADALERAGYLSLVDDLEAICCGQDEGTDVGPSALADFDDLLRAIPEHRPSLAFDLRSLVGFEMGAPAE